MTSEKSTIAIPLIIVEGFLGGLGATFWGSFQNHLNLDCRITRTSRREVKFASVGPVSSLHDRACELYYEIVGGTVDYGELHSCVHSHSQYGRHVGIGLYPKWSRVNRLHFLGHSIGGSTIIKLQKLLADGHFGADSHPDMILSVSAISAPFRGTQLVYILGESETAAPAVRPLSVGSVLTKGVHIASFLAPFMPRFLDFRSESRGLSLSIYSLFTQIWKSDWAESQDATPFDVTFQASDERESRGEGVCYENTYYRSQVASLNLKQDFWNHNVLMAPLYLLSRLMAQFDFSRLNPRPAFLDTDYTVENGSITFPLGWTSNDGVAPVCSQWHPLSCSATRCHHYSWPPEQVEQHTPRRGSWQVYQSSDTHHVSFLSPIRTTSEQRKFWAETGHWLRNIDTTENT